MAYFDGSARMEGAIPCAYIDVSGPRNSRTSIHFQVHVTRVITVPYICIVDGRNIL